ncbi:MAG: indolepyruvate oxidoreductase subunit beta [Ignavibacteriae bacterium]|nr:indolepyruvate oxidoreductase subunit beta [Ignavibacteriota bacterium]
MKKDIILAGVGGQGILSIASVIGVAAVNLGLHLKQAEVHGMSQRGGDVQSHLRLSDKEIASDLIPYGKADMIISVEPMEVLRYLPMISPEGWIITSIKPFINISNYPPLEKIMSEIEAFENHVALDADKIAKESGSLRAANDIDYGNFEEAIKFVFGSKGDDIVNINLKAMKAGRDFAETHSHAKLK